MEPRSSVLNNFVSRMECGRLLHHRTHRAVLFFRQADSFHECCFVEVNTGDDMMYSNRSEDLRRTLCLIGLDPHLIPGHSVVILLTKYRDDVECSTSGETHRHHLDRFRPGSARGVAQGQIVATSRPTNNLALLLKCLCGLDLRCNHECLLQNPSTRSTNKCRRSEFVTGILWDCFRSGCRSKNSDGA